MSSKTIRITGSALGITAIALTSLGTAYAAPTDDGLDHPSLSERVMSAPKAQPNADAAKAADESGKTDDSAAKSEKKADKPAEKADKADKSDESAPKADKSDEAAPKADKSDEAAPKAEKKAEKPAEKSDEKKAEKPAEAKDDEAAPKAEKSDEAKAEKAKPQTAEEKRAERKANAAAFKEKYGENPGLAPAHNYSKAGKDHTGAFDHTPGNATIIQDSWKHTYEDKTTGVVTPDGQYLGEITGKEYPEALDPQTKDQAYEANYSTHLYDDVNAARAKRGLEPLRTTEELHNMAQYRAKEIAKPGKFDHSNEAVPGVPLDSAEVIAKKGGEKARAEAGKPDYHAVTGVYKSSEAHWETLMNPDLTHAGFGSFFGADGALYSAVVLAGYNNQVIDPTEGVTEVYGYGYVNPDTLEPGDENSGIKQDAKPGTETPAPEKPAPTPAPEKPAPTPAPEKPAPTPDKPDTPEVPIPIPPNPDKSVPDEPHPTTGKVVDQKSTPDGGKVVTVKDNEGGTNVVTLTPNDGSTWERTSTAKDGSTVHRVVKYDATGHLVSDTSTVTKPAGKGDAPAPAPVTPTAPGKKVVTVAKDGKVIAPTATDGAPAPAKKYQGTMTVKVQKPSMTASAPAKSQGAQKVQGAGSETLPRTGAESGGLLAAAVGLLGLGGLAGVLARRRGVGAGR